jgi:hypothetical protein
MTNVLQVPYGRPRARNRSTWRATSAPAAIAVSPAGAAAKRRADRKTGPLPAIS